MCRLLSPARPLVIAAQVSQGDGEGEGTLSGPVGDGHASGLFACGAGIDSKLTGSLTQREVDWAQGTRRGAKRNCRYNLCSEPTADPKMALSGTCVWEMGAVSPQSN